MQSIFIGIICLIAIVQTATAIYLSKADVKLEPADLVVVFPGDSERITEGFSIAEERLRDQLHDHQQKTK